MNQAIVHTKVINECGALPSPVGINSSGWSKLGWNTGTARRNANDIPGVGLLRGDAKYSSNRYSHFFVWILTKHQLNRVS